LTDTSAQRRYSDILAKIRQPARLIGNEFGAGPGFSGRADELRAVLAFPDAYEIGISNQAIQILYHLAKQVEGVGVERAYLPWVDAIKEMRQADVPLLTLETWSPVVSADLLGITLQHEFNYTNVLEMLDLAGIPLMATERTGDHPLVIGGGPAVANFLPMAPFLDAVAVGDGEEVFPEILEALVASKRGGESRAEAKGRLSLIEGVFVPGVSATVTRRVLRRLEDAPYPASCLVPLTAGVHDRAWVEVMRGCSRGCRFCQAGMWYRPVRERSPEKVMTMVTDQLEATGHEELALASLSTTDYSGLEELLTGIAHDHPETKVSLPSLRVDSAAVRLAHLVSPTGPSLTLAPEAGSQRMRDFINKNVTEDDVLSAAEEAFRCGYTSLKLYFIIGLPMEADDDVEAIADLCLRIREMGRRLLGQKAGRLQLSVSINNFVPKPFTPFQWVGMAERATLRGRQELLRARLRKPGLRVALHDVEKSYLEAALARGGEGMAAVVLEAWRQGARFDSWTEEFRGAAWRVALETAGTTAEVLATATYAYEAPLPWRAIRGAVDEAYLIAEWRRAALGEKTPDCRDGDCGDCGACVPGIAIDVARAGARQIGSVVDSASGLAVGLAGKGQAAAQTLGPVARPQSRGGRYLLTFAVGGKVKYVGHLDKMELFRRAVRRAGGCLALSAGLRPKPLLSLALPLAVGMEARAEFCEFELATAPPPCFAKNLAAALPAGLQLISLESYEAARHAAARVVAVEYEVELEADQGADLGPVMAIAAERFAAAPQLIREERRDDRVRTLDVKAYVDHVDLVSSGASAATVSFRIAVTPTGSARPERVVEALAELAGIELDMRRGTRTRVVLA
jgi:radical SAM-linked protein